MASTPKKVIERFCKTIPRFQHVLKLAKDRDVNESDTVSILNDILSEVFGYNKYLEVTSEFSIRGTYCDLAIKIEDKVHFLLEAKAIGVDLKDNHIKQACDYGANYGVQWVILTNSIDWRIYRIRFEQPIAYDLIVSFDFFNINLKNENDLDLLFLLSKEGLNKNARDDYYEKVQNINKYVIGNLILNDDILGAIRRELKKIAENIKVDINEIEQIIRTQVLKREIIESDEALVVKNKLNKFYKKPASKKKPTSKQTETIDNQNETVTDKLFREAAES
jgi:hypothetical protein